MLLCVVEGHTDAEGAALLEIPLSTYKGRKRSMLKKLRTHYPDLDLGMLYGEAPPPNDD